MVHATWHKLVNCLNNPILHMKTKVGNSIIGFSIESIVFYDRKIEISI